MDNSLLAVRGINHKYIVVDKKKEVEYLYIEADEDHYNLQFQDKKGDLKYSEWSN